MSLSLFNENFDISGDPKVSAYTRREHEIRYELVLPYVKNKTVLDIGCGYGYGSAMLARTAKSVTAIDLNSEAVTKATTRYSHLTNLNFVGGNAIDFLERSRLAVDIIVMYEVIEHIAAQDKLLQNIWHNLNKDGRLFISTPNRTRTPFYRKNPYHVRELSINELRQLVEKRFVIDLSKGQISGFWAFLPQSFIAPISGILKFHNRITQLNNTPHNSMTVILSGVRKA